MIPRQPVVSWAGLGRLGRSGDVPSLLDGREAIYTWSGRSALQLALQVLGIRAGDRVLMPNYYCPTMIAPLARFGVESVFYPILEDRTPDLVWLRGRDNSGVRAMLAAHFFGLPVDLTPTRNFCDAYAISLIEDCAHAFLGSVNARPVGAWGDVSIGSLPKFFPSVVGGVLAAGRKGVRPAAALVTRTGFASNARAAWNMLQLSAQSGRLPMMSAIRKMRAQDPQENARHDAAATEVHTVTDEPPEVTRSIALSDPLLDPRGLSLVDRLAVELTAREWIVARRRRNYQWLANALKSFAGGRVLIAELPDGAVPYVVPLFVHSPERIYAALRAYRLPVFRWDRYWPGAIDDRQDIGRQWAHHVLQLACHQDLDVNDLNAIVATIAANS